MTRKNGEDLGNFDPHALSLESLMEGLSEVEGYKASAILTSEGEVLYNTTPPNTTGKFGAWMEVFNHLFDHTCNLSEASGFLACQKVSMRTGDEIVTICSSGQHCLVGMRLLVIIDHNGNEARVHQKLDQLLPPLMHCLTKDPDSLVALNHKNNVKKEAGEGHEYREQ